MKSLILSFVIFVGSCLVVAKFQTELSSWLVCGTAFLGFVSQLYVFLRGQKSGLGRKIQNFHAHFEEIFDSSRTLFAQSEGLKKIVLYNGQSVQSASAAMEEISAMLQKTSASSKTLAEISTSSSQSVESGGAYVQQVNHELAAVKSSTQSLENSVADSLKELSQIVDSMRVIQSKTKMINEIVFQTKLLSFNASVEAARAGDSGRGFAVVAEEMAKLASTSGQASQEIEKILDESLHQTTEQIQRVSTHLSSLTQQTVQSVDAALRESARAVHGFEDLKKLVISTSEMSQEISLAAQEQEIGVNEVSKALTSLTTSSDELSDVAANSYKSSFELSEKTNKLLEDVKDLGQEAGVKLSLKVKKFDFQSAISAHIDWKMKLSRYIENPDQSLKADHVCQDNNCALGKWIYGDGAVYKNQFSTPFENLRLSHAEFHKTAGDIIRLIDHGQRDKAEQVMGPAGKYAQVSERTVELIKDLKSLVEEDQGSSSGSDKLAA